MGTHRRALFTALAAALVAFVAVGSASANRLSLSAQSFRFVWRAFTFSGGLLEEMELEPPPDVMCPVTLEGTFHSRTLAKIRNSLIGYVTSAGLTSAACREGTATILREALPWHVQYQSFTGTLPRISGINMAIVGFSIRIESNVTCLARSTATSPFRLAVAVESSGAITGARIDESANIPITGELKCLMAGFMQFGGTGEVTQLGSSTRIQLRLI